VGSSVVAAERQALVMLGSPTSHHAAVCEPDPPKPASAISGSDDDPFSGKRQLRRNEREAVPGKDSSKLPQQVIYHFAIGRATPDPRLEA